MPKKGGRLFITGASTGMGRATALYFADRGWRVYAATRAVRRLKDIASDRLIPVPMDITDPQSVEAALARLDGLDVLVNNAGYGLVGAVEHMDEAQVKAQFEVNVMGLLRVTARAVALMRPQGRGVIVNISSFLGKVGLPILTFYNATKYAVEGITDSLRHELAPFGIRVHSVMPGFFDTQFARANLVKNADTFSPDSPYTELVGNLAPKIVAQINGGDDPREVAALIWQIVQDPAAPARMSVGQKARKLIPMRKELSDEDFERRVREYFGF